MPFGKGLVESADEPCGPFDCAERARACWGGPPQGGDDAALEIGF